MGFRGAQWGRRWLFANQQFYFWNYINNYLADRTERIKELGFPVRNLRFRFGQDLFHRFAKSLNKSTIRQVAFKLIKLPGNKSAVFLDYGFMNFVDQRRLAHPRIAIDQRKHSPTLAQRVESGEQRVDIAITAIKLLRNLKAKGHIMLARYKVRNLLLVRPRREALLQIGADAIRTAVPLFWRFRQ